MNSSQKSVENKPKLPNHILIVEDDPSVANNLKVILTEEGYDADVAMTGETALDKFRSNGFDLVVVNLQLPDINGMDVIRQVNEEKPEIKILVITGYPSVSTAVESAKIGVSDYLRKPFTDEEFKTSVDRALKAEAKPTADKFLSETREGKLIQKREVLRVLDLTYEEPTFLRDLLERGSNALEDYQISNNGKEAIISGDLKWINENVGELTQKQLMFILKRLETEG